MELRSRISPLIPVAGDLKLIVAGIEDFSPLAFSLPCQLLRAIKVTAILCLLSFFVQPVGLHLQRIRRGRLAHSVPLRG